MEETLIPFMGDMEEYVRALDDYLEDSAFEQLGQALGAGDVRTARDAAQQLQHSAGKLGLMPVYEVLYNIVEPLKLNMADGLEEDYTQLLVLREQLQNIRTA
jgi:HEAT repeat protein